jgi:F-type H+-transporting ATPase subunit a
MTVHYLAADISPGEHVTGTLWGMTFNLDTIWSTAIAGAIVIGLGLFVRWKVTSGKPTRTQLFFETVTSQVEGQVETTLGIKTAPWLVPFAMTLFLLIFIANTLAVFPSGHPERLPPPAADVNFTFALALIVIITMHIVGVRKKGFRGYYGHLTKPLALTPINIVEELTKPITLALRLFGNIFSGTIMVSVISLFPAYILWFPNAAWKLFDLGIGLIQAFIFALLTVLYFGSVAPDEQGAH